MSRLPLLLVLASLGGAWAVSRLQMAAYVERSAAGSNSTKFLPVVLWHGMGDSCCSSQSMGAVKSLIKATLPGVFVHSIATGGSEVSDVMSSYFGSVNEQVARVCDELLEMEELREGYVAVGFSQGGQFMRAVAQRCQHLGPRMHTLVTMGAQHQGVSSVPGCPAPDMAPDGGGGGGGGGGGDGGHAPSLLCKLMQGIIARGAYQPWVQAHSVQAQYVKDPAHLDLYRERSTFLADVNGEVAGRPPAVRYRQNLASLQRLVLFQFDEDDMVVPRESAHFAVIVGTALLALRDTPLYRQDWIGLRALDEGGRLTLAHAPGMHMQFSLEWFKQNVVLPYLAVPAEAAGAGEEAAGKAGAAGRQVVQQ